MGLWGWGWARGVCHLKLSPCLAEPSFEVGFHDLRVARNHFPLMVSEGNEKIEAHIADKVNVDEGLKVEHWS